MPHIPNGSREELMSLFHCVARLQHAGSDGSRGHVGGPDAWRNCLQRRGRRGCRLHPERWEIAPPHILSSTRFYPHPLPPSLSFSLSLHVFCLSACFLSFLCFVLFLLCMPLFGWLHMYLDVPCVHASASMSRVIVAFEDFFGFLRPFLTGRSAESPTSKVPESSMVLVSISAMCL